LTESKSAAIFDLDGTLIPHTSAEGTFFFHMLKSGNLSFLNILQMLAAIWSARGNLHNMLRGNKRYLRKKEVEKLDQVARQYFEPRIDDIIFPEMRQIIEEHKKKQHYLLLLTGTLDVIARCFVRHLGFDGFQATTLERKDGYYTGRINGILPYGMGKLEVLRDLKNRFGFNRDNSWLYANIFSDRYVLNAVEHPVAVNPDSKLREYARRLGWEIVQPSNPGRKYSVR
ncbi:MAG: HAD family hydrolase, partial [Chitinispirillaceae bacterium]